MSLLSEIYKRFVIGSLKNTEEIPCVDEWMRFLKDLPVPSDEVDRSFNKYQCRKRYISKGRLALLNIASLICLVGALPRVIKRRETLSAPQTGSLVIMRESSVRTDDILPAALIERFSMIKEVERPSYKNGLLCGEAKKIFINCVKRHPASFYFLLFVLKELSIHSALLTNYDAEAVAVYVAERNIATPLLRKLYEESGREFDSFMHGEYLLQMIQAYSSFTNYYVWDESYISMFKSLRFHCGSFRVYTPKKLQKKWNLERAEPDHFCTYYFSGESKRSIKTVAILFEALEKQGLVCKVRPHPRYSHLEIITTIFPSNRIEDPSRVSMKDSLASAHYVVGLTTTVLFEAKAEGKQVVLDDLSDPRRLEDLRARKFRLLNDRPLLFSEIDEVREVVECGRGLGY